MKITQVETTACETILFVEDKDWGTWRVCLWAIVGGTLAMVLCEPSDGHRIYGDTQHRFNKSPKFTEDQWCTGPLGFGRYKYQMQAERAGKPLQGPQIKDLRFGMATFKAWLQWAADKAIAQNIRLQAEAEALRERENHITRLQNRKRFTLPLSVDRVANSDNLYIPEHIWVGNPTDTQSIVARHARALRNLGVPVKTRTTTQVRAGLGASLLLVGCDVSDDQWEAYWSYRQEYELPRMDYSVLTASYE